ncbi:SDR family oxidoreductase [Mycobacterium sp. CVI_P3]|uniref:SDR family oxidoreductase n=2 Tax=Mycobacterium pinniadriaticum TaxID=2994102 RepID=A0ABT3SG05_9MYCO|nr:SDR family oxidoreductase [Mycobacterium pinniadriaticum]MCX2938446.1 SDR family oxidoreductase [Mycobacterium pinniadriaticum]
MPKLAVITGGAGGMGLATAHIIGRHSAVLISDVDRGRLDAAQRELVDAGVECEAAECDITDRESVRRLVNTARQLGVITSVVHTAGVSPGMGSADLILRINAVGTVLVNSAFYEIAEEGMAVVNVASVAGHQLPEILAPRHLYTHAFSDVGRFHSDLLRLCSVIPGRMRPELAYVLSKNFVIWYSKAFAAQFGGKGARVVSVSPGSFDTPMGKLEEDAGAGALVELGAIKRFGRPAEIAELLAFCAGDKPGYLTGTDIICDGGVTAAMTVKAALRLALSR